MFVEICGFKKSRFKTVVTDRLPVTRIEERGINQFSLCRFFNPFISAFLTRFVSNFCLLLKQILTIILVAKVDSSDLVWLVNAAQTQEEEGRDFPCIEVLHLSFRQPS